MRCSYAADGLGLLVVLRLVAAGDRRWAITMRAANEQRLRHFEAIANSFQPVLIVLRAVLLGLHRRDGVAAAEPVEQILVAAARASRTAAGAGSVGRPQIGQFGLAAASGRSVSPAMRSFLDDQLAGRQRRVGHELRLLAEPLARSAPGARGHQQVSGRRRHAHAV